MFCLITLFLESRLYHINNKQLGEIFISTRCLDFMGMLQILSPLARDFINIYDHI